VFCALLVHQDNGKEFVKEKHARQQKASQDLGHTSLSDLLPRTPWQLDLHIPIRQVNCTTRLDDIQEVFLQKSPQLCTRLRTLFSSDSECSECKQQFPDCSCGTWGPLPSHTTFQPTSELLQRLPHADRPVGDRLHRFGRVGSPFCGFSLEDIAKDDDMGSFMSLLYLS
jgi:hypothetical protein